MIKHTCLAQIFFCMSCFPFFLFSSFFLLLRFLQDEVPGSSSSPALRAGVIPGAPQIFWAVVSTLQREPRAACSQQGLLQEQEMKA